MTAFAAYFKLKDQRRTSFMLNPEKDATLYVDQGGLLEIARKVMQDTPPRAVFEGDFGTGKTHLLRYFEKKLAPEAGWEPIYLKLSGFKARSDYIAMHRRLLPRFLDRVKPLIHKAKDRKRLTDELGEKDFGMGVIRAVDTIGHGLGFAPTPAAIRAEAWLAANLTTAASLRAGYASLIQEVAGPVEFVLLYRILAAFYTEETGKKLLMLLDEGESFTRVTSQDGQAGIGQMMREFFDAENDSVGLIMGLTTPSQRGISHPMLRSDVRSRTQHYKVLPPLASTKSRDDFLTKVWYQLTDQRELLPFMLATDAHRFVISELDRLRPLTAEGRSLTHTPTQRDLLSVLTMIGKTAVDEKIPTPISAATLRSWFPE